MYVQWSQFSGKMVKYGLVKAKDYYTFFLLKKLSFSNLAIKEDRIF